MEENEAHFCGAQNAECKGNSDERIIEIKSSDPNKPTIKIKDIHINSCSDIFDPKKNYVGLITYLCENKNDFASGSVHCKTGDIYIKESDWILNNIRKRNKRGKYLHGRLFRSIFGCWKTKKLGFVGAGFSYYNNKWIFNSGTFNTMNPVNNDDTYHNTQRKLHQVEEKLLKNVISCLYDNHRWLEILSDRRISLEELDEMKTQTSKKSKISCVVDLSKVHVDRKLHGTVKWFDDKRGYGFIECTGLNQNIFVHYSNTKSWSLNSYYFTTDQNVEFSIIMIQNG